MSRKFRVSNPLNYIRPIDLRSLNTLRQDWTINTQLALIVLSGNANQCG